MALRFRAAQPYLANCVKQANYQLGVGAGAGVFSSGESACIQLLTQASQEELCIFDVGANEGNYVEMLLLELGGRAAQIHCFEPSAAAFEVLEERLASVPTVILNHCGLGRSAGTFKLYSDRSGSTLASLTQRDLSHLGLDFTVAEDVSIQTLDAYCSHQAVTRVDLLKVDVEGHELDVFKGSSSMLRENRVRLVQFEFGGCNIDTRTFVRDYWSFFREYGMCGFFRLMPSGRLYEIAKYEEQLEQFQTTNFLVVLDKQIAESVRI